MLILFINMVEMVIAHVLFPFSFVVVIAFAGDSLLCFFSRTSDSTDSCECCVRAIQCGSQIAKCHIEETTTHVGITYGEVCFGLLGRKENYVVVMNGKLVDEIAVCLDNAKSEEIVISSACYSQLVDNNPFKFQYIGFCSHDNMRLECYALVNGSSRFLSSQDLVLRSISATDDDIMLNQFHFDMMNKVIPPPVIQAASTGSFSHLSEIRTVTTLFLKLDSYSTKKFSHLTSLNPFFSAMVDCLVACGGMLRQFLIDDKGCVLIALWGVPTASHSNNCCMAVRCSVMMRTRATELNETVSIGLTTGSVYCGIVGGTMRRDYVAIGHPVNLSARLMCKANGMILLDHVTQQKLPLVLMTHLTEVTGLKMKGIDQFSQYYRYDSLILPSERLRDVREEQMVILDQFIKRKRLEIFRLLGLTSDTPGKNVGVSNRTFISTADQLQVEDFDSSMDSLPIMPPSTQVLRPQQPARAPLSRALIIEGGAGSGKTTTLNYFIRKIWDGLNKTGEGNMLPKSGLQASFSSSCHTPNLTPLLSFDENSTVTPIVFISLLPSADNKPYHTIQSILEILLKKATSTTNYHKLLKYFLLKAFPTLSTNEIASEIFPFLQETLHLVMTFDEFMKLPVSSSSLSSSSSSSQQPKDEITMTSPTPEESEHPFESILDLQPIPMISKLLSMALDFFGVVVLAIEDAHFMCKDSWLILSHCQHRASLGLEGSGCFLLMTMRKKSSHHVAYSDPVIKLAKTKREQSVASLSHASSRMTTQSAQKLMSNLSIEDSRLVSFPSIFSHSRTLLFLPPPPFS
jgi:class 3 adenylate cyclase